MDMATLEELLSRNNLMNYAIDRYLEEQRARRASQELAQYLPFLSEIRQGRAPLVQNRLLEVVAQSMGPQVALQLADNFAQQEMANEQMRSYAEMIGKSQGVPRSVIVQRQPKAGEGDLPVYTNYKPEWGKIIGTGELPEGQTGPPLPFEKLPEAGVTLEDLVANPEFTIQAFSTAQKQNEELNKVLLDYMKRARLEELKAGLKNKKVTSLRDMDPKTAVEILKLKADPQTSELVDALFPELAAEINQATGQGAGEEDLDELDMQIIEAIRRNQKR